jgi:hypothetical protein
MTKQDDEVEFSFQRCKDDPKGCEPKGWTTLSGQPYIHPLPNDYPLYFIKTDDTIMGGHSDIFNPQVRAFLVTVIDDVVRGKLATAKAAGAPKGSSRQSILTRPDELVRRMQERYAEMPPDSWR